MILMKACVLAVGIAISGSFAPLVSAVTVDDFVARTFANSSSALPYRLFVPTNYNVTAKYPLVLFCMARVSAAQTIVCN